MCLHIWTPVQSFEILTLIFLNLKKLNKITAAFDSWGV